MIKSRNPDYIINTIAKSRITEKIRSNEDYLSTDDAESPPPDIVRLSRISCSLRLGHCHR